MKIKEYRTWSVVDVRAMCIRENLFTCGTNDEYDDMFKLVRDLEPTVDNIYAVAKSINDHSEYNTVENIMYMLANDVVRYGYEIEN